MKLRPEYHRLGANTGNCLEERGGGRFPFKNFPEEGGMGFARTAPPF